MSKTVTRVCIKCEKKKRDEEFYVSSSPLHNGKIPFCKPCIWEQVDSNNMESVKDTLRMIDRPYIQFLWNSSKEEAETVSKDPFRILMKNLGMKQYRDLTWKDSVFEERLVRDLPLGDSHSPVLPKQQSNFVVTDETINKWGYGYLQEEYKAFEQKYQMLKNNYQEKTAMHTEALLTYIRYRVKEELATAKDDMKSAKEWGQLAQKAAQDAKINPSQLSKSDLSDGLDTFGQLVRSVEQAVDIIPILPQFRERPQDKVDFTLWCYVNYVRDLKGLPLATYEEIYSFYDQRKKDFESSVGAFDGEL